MSYDVAGVGNALMDALVLVEDDAVLSELNLQRGITHNVDHAGWERAYHAVRHHKVTFESGGSCANAIATVGLLGGRSVFYGLVGDDQMGAMYAARLEDACGAHALRASPVIATGKCLSIISAVDAERTMVTDLGAAIALEDLGDFGPVLRATRIGHFEGYGLLGEPSRGLILDAMRLVHAGGGKVSLDVSDPFVVRAVTEPLREALRDHVDIAFLNAEEARALTGMEPERAIHSVADDLGVATVVVKLGGHGSLVRDGADLHHIGIRKVHAIDSTGAGDAYAGGFLYGISRGWDARRSGELASAVAALTVSQIGAVAKDRVALERVLASVANA